MTLCALALLATLTVWDYPSRQAQHERLRRDFIVALRDGDTATMTECCRKGVALLPDDPTWRYNLACALAYYKDKKPALDALEEAIDLGFRNADAIAKDNDLKRLAGESRFSELVEYAREISTKPILTGPLAVVPATGVFGTSVALGAQNLAWNFDVGCFEARLELATASAGGNTGDLYMNRDGGHSLLDVAAFPGLTAVRLDSEGRLRGMDKTFPNMLFPYPVFGNCSQAFLNGPYWRSMPRALCSTELNRLAAQAHMYLSNQVWVFPICWDAPPLGTNGDVCASLTPYWLQTEGRSFSDLPYVRLALEASRSFPTETKRALVKRGLLAPTIMTLIRKCLPGVPDENAYLTRAAHPTALPMKGPDPCRLAAAAAQLKSEAIPPLVAVSVKTPPVKSASPWPELVYATAFAWSFVLRADQQQRTFSIQASGAEEYRFVQTHGSGVAVDIRKLTASGALVTLDRRGLSPTNRVDIAVFGRNAGTGWGAPSYISIARMDPDAPYSDPVFTIRSESTAK